MDNIEKDKEKKEAFSILDFFIILAKRWKLIIITTAITAVLINMYANWTETAPIDAKWNKLPNRYAAKVVVKVDTGSSTSAAVLSSSGLASVLSGRTFSGTANTEIEFIVSLLKGPTLGRRILEAVREENKIEQPLSAGMIIGSIQPIYNPTLGNILEIRYIDYYPELTVYMAGKVVEELEKRYNQFSMEKIVYKREFLEDRLAQIESQMEEAEAALNEFKRESGIVGMERGETRTGLYVQELVFTEYIPKERRYEIENQYATLNKEVSHYQTLYELLLQQYEAAKMEELDESKHFQVVEPAVSIGRIGPNRKQMIMVITMAALGLSIVVAFLMHYIEKVRKDPEESQKAEELREAFFGPRRKKK